MKVATVIGARPQFIKASVVSEELGRRKDVSETLIHTGQHYDPSMSQVFFDDLGIPPPQHNLGIGSASHAVATARMLERLEPILQTEAPDCVLVYGDTNSTVAGALVATKLQLPVAHVEAGLRSWNRKMPEEINRIMTDSVSDLLFAPTQFAVDNLTHEGHPSSRIALVGDVMFDVALAARERAARESTVLEGLGLARGKYILATIHRAENTDDVQRLASVLGGLAEVAKTTPVVFPIHPRTKKMIEFQGLGKYLAGISTIAPVGYLDMVELERNARLIVTDSGGVQKEAFFHGVICVTLRDETEWVELVELGWNFVTPPLSAATVSAGVERGLNAGRGKPGRPYGNGDAATRIVDRLLMGFR